MRINHTLNERFKVYNYLPCKSELFKNVRRWYFYKSYSTKQAALSGIKNAKRKYHDRIGDELLWKIVWSPYPFAGDDECIIVYNEEI